MAAPAAAGKGGVLAPVDDKAARYAHLLNPIRDLAQNWNIDVARDLEDYLEDLESIEISFDGGVTSLNFAEAARLIQGSACVYSRKVEYLYTLIYQALELLSAQTKKKKATGGDGANAVDADAAALEEEAREEFLLLDDLVKESAHVDLAERPEDVAAALDMTLAYCGGAGATPSQRRHAAAAVARTPLYVMASTRFDRREEGGADFLLQACSVSRAGALLLEAPPLPSRSNSGGPGGVGFEAGGFGRQQLAGQAQGLHRDDGSGGFALALSAPAAPAMLADLSIAPIGQGDRSLAAAAVAALSASGRLLAGAEGSNSGGDGAPATGGKPGKHVSFAAAGEGGMDVDGNAAAAAGAGDGGAQGDGPLAAANRGHGDDDGADEDDGNGYLRAAYDDDQRPTAADFNDGYGDDDGAGAGAGAGAGQGGFGIAGDDGDDLDRVPVPGAAAAAAAAAAAGGGLGGAQSERAERWAAMAPSLRAAMAALGNAPPPSVGEEAPGKWSLLDPLADAGPASHRPYRKGRPFLKLRNAGLVSHRGPQAAAAAEMAAAAADGNRGIGDARQLAALARAAAAEASVSRMLGTGAGSGLFRGATGKGAGARAAAAQHTVSMALALASAGAAAAGSSSSSSASCAGAPGAEPAAVGASASRLPAHLHALGAAMLHTLSSSSSSSVNNSSGAKGDPLSPMLLTSAPLAAELEPRMRQQKAAALQARLQARRAEAKRSAKAAAAGAAYAQTALGGGDGDDDEEGNLFAYGMGAGAGAGGAGGSSDPYAAAFLGHDGDDDDGAGYGDGDGDAPMRGDGFGGVADGGAGAAGAGAGAGGADGAAAGEAGAAAAADGTTAARSAAAAAAGAGRSLFSWLDDAAAGADLVRGEGLGLGYGAGGSGDSLLGKLGLLGGMGRDGDGYGDDDDGDGSGGALGFGGVTYADLVRQHMRAIEANVRDAAAFASETGMAKRVTVWQERLEPLLGDEERRREFDVHVYGDEVLGRLLAEAVAARGANAPSPSAAAASAAAGLKGSGAAATRDLSAVAESGEEAGDTSADASQQAEAPLAMLHDSADGADDDDDVDPETGRPLRAAGGAAGGKAAGPATDAASWFASAGGAAGGAAGGSPLPAVDFGRVVPRSGERWEVCRSFLATLMLANAGNVLILPPGSSLGAAESDAPSAAAAASAGAARAAPSRSTSSRGGVGAAGRGAAAGKSGSSASSNGGDAAGDAWLFSQAVPFHADDAAQDRAVAAAGAAGRARSGAGGVMASFEGAGSEAAFAARVEAGASFGLRLLNPSRRLVGDAFEAHQAEVHAPGGGAGSSAGAGVGAAERRPRKRAAEDFAAAGAGAGGTGKRTALEEAGSGEPVARSASSGGASAAAARAASGSPVRSGAGRSRSSGGAGPGAAKRKASFGDELLDHDDDDVDAAALQPPSPAKPGELGSPLHKRLRRTGPLSPGSPGAAGAGAGAGAGGRAGGGRAAAAARRGFRGGAAAAGDSGSESPADSDAGSDESDYDSDKGKGKGKAGVKAKSKGKAATGKGKVSSMAARLHAAAPTSGR